MSIYIKGMEMPKEPGWVIAIHQNEKGSFFACSDEPTSKDDEWHEIIPVPDHGRLGDLDKLEDYFKAYKWDKAADIVCFAPTIIPADK